MNNTTKWRGLKVFSGPMDQPAVAGIITCLYFDLLPGDQGSAQGGRDLGVVRNEELRPELC
ncbi:MAG: hypothetical protein WDK95_13060, partial [Syntrophorhabdaceae bacterium]